MLRIILLNKRFYAIAVLVLFLAFAFNGFGVSGAERPNWFTTYQKDSEALVVNQMACRELLGRDNYGGQMVKFKAGTPAVLNPAAPACPQPELEGYVSQYGLQGKLVSFGYQAADKLAGISMARYYALLQLLMAGLSALTIAWFVVWVRERFGAIAGVTSLVLVGLSPWVVGLARNLYWVMPLLFLPFIYTLYHADVHRPWRKRLLFFAVLAVLLYLRFLNGYEYISTVLLSVLAASAYLIYEKDGRLRRLLQEATVVFAVGVFAFLSALGTHYYQAYHFTGRDSQAAIRLIRERAFSRTTGNQQYRSYVYSGLLEGMPQVYVLADNYLNLQTAAVTRPPLLTELVSIIHYALLPVISLPLAIKEPFGALVQSFALFVVAVFLIFKRLSQAADRRLAQPLRGFKAALLVGLLAALSWLVLARGHAYVHAHINGIVYYLPFGLFAYALAGILIDRLWHVRRQPVRHR